MADYEKMTVANLRVLLKDRGIPSTGLSRKAQIVARLQEEDAAAAEPEQPASPQAEQVDAQAEEAEEQAESVVPQPDPAPIDVPETTGDIVTIEAQIQTAEMQEDEVEEPQQQQQEKSPTEANGTHEDSAVAPEPSSPIVRGTKSNRSLSQTPLPSKEDPIPQPVPVKSMDSTPAVTRENTVATTSTDREERMKRKRRSESPTIDTQELAIKRARVAEEVHLKEDPIEKPPVASQYDVVMSEADTTKQAAPRAEAGRDHGVEGIDMAKSQEQDAAKVLDTRTSAEQEMQAEKEAAIKTGVKQPKDNRYQELIAADRSTESKQPVAVEDLPTPPPSIHAATRALYVRNFMRPLQVNALKSHILSLAGSEDEEIIETLYVDSVKTHAFVVVKSLAAAARIRAGLHEQVWPKERDRKPLWADYIPPDEVSKWIESEENNAGGPRPGGRKWEVVYDEVEGDIITQHVEIGASSGLGGSLKRPEQSTISKDRALLAAPAAQPEVAAKSFIALDKLFKSTQAKPMLYYMPVEIKIADKRLDEIEDLTSKRWSSRDWKDDDELRRFTFEEDRLVDSGRHNVQRRAAESSRGGPSSRFGRGPPRGAYRGSWR